MYLLVNSVRQSSLWEFASEDGSEPSLSLLFLLLLFFLFFLLLIRAILLGRQPLRKGIMIHMTWCAVWYCFRVGIFTIPLSVVSKAPLKNEF